MRFMRGKMNGTKKKTAGETARSYNDRPLSVSLSDNIDHLYAIFNQTPDLVVRQLTIKKSGSQAALVYLDGLTDKNAINNNVLRPLQNENGENSPNGLPAVTIGDAREMNGWAQLEKAILTGCSILLIEGSLAALVMDTHGWPQRAIEDPQLEASLKGAHQGFVETGSQNIALIRRYLPDRELKITEHVVGKRGKTTVSLLYLGDVANLELLQELSRRIESVDTDSVINTGELVEFIEDNPYSPFPQFVLTERPDAAASQLLQGRFVAVVDRSPSVLIGPAGFSAFFQSVDDYSTRWMVATFIRILRFLGFLIAIFLPAMYIAVISFNYEVIPLKLLLSIGESRERVPFPPILEALLMEVTLEMLREAGIRLPTPVGQTVGIVGGIVIGQAAVQAGIVSNIMVIVVAFTAIASFIIPNYDMASAIRLIRFPMMLIASMFGIVGITIGLMTLIGHIIALETLGTPYGIPFAPVRFSDWKDTFVRLPLWQMVKRPHGAKPQQFRRQGTNRPKGEDK
ncbi:spore germination protein [Paenibacillus contaminans]|uniref:Spore germination protein n=1 Tax=Paenibacillus contaminans TaxID=450362 RepID=A0A329MLE1_9BACL|nr:spore germination protein [Paenibacillus contaminans]RAV20388.1 spore germination protein [Paenibacillus contaminans]